MPERGDDVVEAGLVGHERVGVALDDHGLARLADRPLRLVDEVQRAALVEQRRRRGVEVLGALALEQPPTEPDRRAVRVADREDDPLAEAVVDAATARLARLGEADLDELLAANVAARGQLPGERVPAAGRPAELVLRDRLVGEAALVEVVERGLRPTFEPGQHRVVEGDRALEDVAEPLLPGVLAGGPLVELDAGLGREHLERLGERQPVALHHEAEDVAALAAAEALPGVADGRHGERGRLLAVERAQALVRGPGLLQLDRLADDVDDAELALDFGCDADRQTAPPRSDRAPPTPTGHANGLVKS